MNRKLWLLTAGDLVIGSGSQMVVGILNPITRDLGISLAQAGTLTTAYALAFAIGAPLSARS